MFLKSDTTSGIINSHLMTPHYPDTSGSCLRWYMLLQNTATLNVRTFAYGVLNPTILYTAYGTQGSQWKLAQVTVRSGSPYQAVFEGVLNTVNETLDSIAIDDVGIESGVCANLASCDFERDLCGYQYLKADFDWKRTTYNIELYNAPQFDHTTLSAAGNDKFLNHIDKFCCCFFFKGYYLWMDRRQTVAGRKARIESELLLIDVKCISFYYYIVNTVGAKLNVYIRDPRSEYENLIWSTDQAPGTFWVLQEITVRPNMTVNGTNRFTIVYEAVVGTKTGGMN